MYHINYYKQQINEHNTLSLKLFLQACTDKQLYQPKIFCDNINISIASNIPIFHSYYMRQHFHKCLIMTDYEDLDYIQAYHNTNFMILYNPMFQPKQFEETYKYLSIEDSFYNFLEENCNEYKI